MDVDVEPTFMDDPHGCGKFPEAPGARRDGFTARLAGITLAPYPRHLDYP